MRLHDRAYFQRRAEAKLDLAQRAKNPAAVRAHYELLGHYLNRLYPPEDPSAYFEQGHPR